MVISELEKINPPCVSHLLTLLAAYHRLATPPAPWAARREGLFPVMARMFVNP